MDLLPKILPPLFRALAATGMPFEVIVSDDCSKDGSVTYLQTEFPSIIVLTAKENKGFSHTCNKAIFTAQFDYVLLLNSDVILTENYFAPQMKYFEDDDTFGVMGRIIGWDDEKIQDGAKYPSFQGAKIKTAGNYIVENSKEGDWQYSMYLSGANAFVKREKLVELQGFDEIYSPFYVEDFDLSLRAWRIGWKCYYEHFAICRHKTSVTIKTKNKKKYINTIYYRNKMFLHAIHLDGPLLFFWYLQLIPEALIRIFTLRFYYLTSLRLFFMGKPMVNKSRKRFAEIMKDQGERLTVKQVMNRVRTALLNRTIKRF